jgi:hypothetical protein
MKHSGALIHSAHSASIDILSLTRRMGQLAIRCSNVLIDLFNKPLASTIVDAYNDYDSGIEPLVAALYAKSHSPAETL